MPQGKVRGGSSSINGMVYNRGQRADFDHWAQFGNRGWGFDDLLPYFKRSERRIGAGIFASKQPTLMFNGYGEEVAHLYKGLDLRRNY